MVKKEAKDYAFKRGKEDNCECDNHKCCKKNYGCNGCCAIYGLGIIGSAVYYISTASSFWIGVLGVIKALVWPAILVYSLLKQLGL